MAPHPVPSFEHLLRLSDDTGLLEHARGAIPRRHHGYCVDDVARGLVVLCREPGAAPALRAVTERYLAFVAHAQTPDGRFHNRLGYDRRWHDTPGTGDWWGRALWGLGTAAARGTDPWLRDEALTCFELGAAQRSRAPRAMAFAAFGAAEILDRYPDHPAALALLKDAATTAGQPCHDPGWPWPEPRLHYANAALAEVLIVAGIYCHDQNLTTDGLRLLEWLVGTQTVDGHLSLTPTGGWRAPEPRPGFDQQPIEAATLADACARALALTGDGYWAVGMRRAVAWFQGDNDGGTAMMDPATGGCFDGLGPSGPNINQGAESTLALISTLQHGHALASGRVSRIPYRSARPRDGGRAGCDSRPGNSGRI
jgi:hypothetical protein